jgi:hypothetical protein
MIAGIPVLSGVCAFFAVLLLLSEIFGAYAKRKKGRKEEKEAAK